MLTDVSRFGLLLLITAIIVGANITKRGGRQLSEEQRRELAASGLSGPGMAVLLGLLACVLFARTFALFASIAAIALTLLCAYIMLPRFNRPEWPQAARRSLMLGNAILWFGSLGLVLATAMGVR